MFGRLRDLLAALTAFVLGGFLAWHYPLGHVFATVLFVATGILAYHRLSWFLVIVPALLPVVGFAPWTGWLTFEEVDLMVLAMASGGYARRFVYQPHSGSSRRSWLLPVFLMLMAFSVSISMVRGFVDAGGFSFGWFQGYDGSMNSIRIGKSFFLALLLLPLIAQLQRDPQQGAGSKLAWGMAMGLGTASLAALWERLAFTDLLNFSSDYRSTALFWEMHVGGAALDGWLLLTAPFAIWAVRNSRTWLHHVFSIALVILAAYAALTTFSRGVYLALIVALPLLAWQTRNLVGGESAQLHQPIWGPLRWTTALIMLGAMAFAVFAGGGYRGLMALMGVVAVALSMPAQLRGIKPGQYFVGTVIGLIAGGLIILLLSFVEKGPYIAYAALFICMLAFLYWSKKRQASDRYIYCSAGFSALAFSAVHVAFHWGGEGALWGMLGSMLVVSAVVTRGAFSASPIWPNDIRWQANFFGGSVAICAVVAVFVGGAYVGERFATSEKDLDGRFDHWNLSMSMLQDELDVAFGKGLGRYSANYFYAIPDNKFPGTYQVIKEQEKSSLVLVAPRRGISFGDALRVSQRLDFDASGPFEATLQVRAKSGATITVEVCEKHLLYAAECAIGQAKLKPDEEIQSARVQLKGKLLGYGSWYAPRTKIFSIAIANRSGSAEIDTITLTTPGGPNLLQNSDFDLDMQNWFFSSDRDHMPWHAKNILVNVIFDQGIVGLLIFLLLVGAAVSRLTFGKSRQHELAPYLLAAIVGFLVVGMFDSLIDTPRLAFVFYLLVLLALTLNIHGAKRRVPKLHP
jgi:hypothetical protein